MPYEQAQRSSLPPRSDEPLPGDGGARCDRLDGNGGRPRSQGTPSSLVRENARARLGGIAMKRAKEYGDWSFATLDIATKDKNKKVKVTHNSPLLPPALEEKPTLVLDIDETLIHAHKATASLKLFSGKTLPLQRYLVAKRPGVDTFLDEMSKIYEIVVFTRAVKPYADRILDRLDPTGNLFTHHLYRDSCSPKEVRGKKVVKDLSRLGRDLRHTVIVDDKPESFCLQPSNGLVIRAFKNRKGHKYDELKKISNLLKEIARVEDVRQALEKLKG
ncbi:probable C-terminal domain small phosphatase [Selaginella moellendorffii]|nr:probable C-terminal domain small phosphatase [Selaginella moellendorffii]|eukprot:XP_002985977.2 probable C-terminal domain small phosphatase [Selaginella moellendorffii]